MRQKIDIAEVESATKIRAKYLRALENEEFGLLPGNTFVKTFLRTYAEYLGLDAQLLIEEYRVEHEPRGEGEMQPMVSRPSRRQQERRRPRAQRGPPGPGTAIVVVVVVVLAIFAILGLTSGGKDDTSDKSAAKSAGSKTDTTPAKPKPKKRKPVAPTTVKLRIVPSSATYLCVDKGLGTAVLYQGTTVDPQSFKGKHLRVNIGNASTVRVSANGKRVALPATATIVGYDFTPRRSKPLAAGQTRPCA